MAVQAVSLTIALNTQVRFAFGNDFLFKLDLLELLHDSIHFQLHRTAPKVTLSLAHLVSQVLIPGPSRSQHCRAAFKTERETEDGDRDGGRPRRTENGDRDLVS